ncbi:MAG: MscL family protein [Candidatus Pacebacteria bacterium]|jgi:large conductance mechanosensitive channel|nr:MscL family protein [Candidatus Paceibacterota bacterium]
MMEGFLNFIRKQGVVGLAVGFILGGAVSKLVAAIVTDIINPLLGVVIGFAGDLNNASVNIGPAKLMYGDFINTTINFIVVALVVYYGVKALGLEKLDKPKA